MVLAAADRRLWPRERTNILASSSTIAVWARATSRSRATQPRGWHGIHSRCLIMLAGLVKDRCMLLVSVWAAAFRRKWQDISGSIEIRYANFEKAYLEPERIASLSLISTAAQMKNTVVGLPYS